MQSHPPRRSNSALGFTLIELMVTVAIVGLLAALAYPSFTEYVRKGRRADAVAALAQVQHAQERFRANNATYAGGFDSTGADAALLRMSNVSPDGHYALAVTQNTATTYIVTATAKSSSPQYKDAQCRLFQVSMSGAAGLIQYASEDDAGTSTTSARNPCWVK